MNLRTVCQFAVVVTIFALIVSLAGYVLVYIPSFRHMDLSHTLLNIIPQLLIVLLRVGGILMFFLAFSGRLRNGASNAPLFIASGILILIGTLIIGGTSLMSIKPLFEHFSRPRFAYHMGMMFLYFLYGLCFSIFAFSSCGRESSSKALASVIAGICLILMACGVYNFIQIISQYQEHPNQLNMIGSVIMTLGYFAKSSMVLVFMFTYLTSPGQQMGPGEDNQNAEFTGYTDPY